MMNFVIPLLVIVSLACDYLFWRSRHEGLSLGLRRLIYGSLLLCALLPLLPILEGLMRSDNLRDQAIFKGGWLLLIFLCALARMVLYVGWQSRRWWLRIASVAVACGVVALLVWSVAVGRTALRVERVTVRSHKLPEGWHGARLLHLSDLHIGAMTDPEGECHRLVDTILKLQPELILLTGDLTHIRHTELDKGVMAALAQLQAPLGVYSVTGNHDVGVYVKDSIALPREENLRQVIEKQRKMGWQLLENENRYLVRHGDTITLTGIGFEPSLRNLRHARRLPDDYQPWGVYDTLRTEYFNLTLCHLPQLWEGIRALGQGDLTLAGHVHSMQHKLPIGKRGWSLSALLYRRWSGLYEELGGALYINDGIGSVGIPGRLGATPELTLITLEKREEYNEE